MTNPQTEARAIAWKHFEGILSALDKAGVVVPKELAGRTDYFAELRSLADDITTALAAKDAARDEAVFLKDCAEAALVKRESELVAKNAELAAVKENCETVCNSYADENQRLYDRAERAEAQLAEANRKIAEKDRALEPFARFAKIGDVATMKSLGMKPDAYHIGDNDTVVTGGRRDHESYRKITWGHLRAARRALEAQGGENG